MQNNNIYSYIEMVGENIITGNLKDLKEQQIICVKTNRKNHCIVWNYNNANKFPIFKYLTCGLISRLQEKQKQLSAHKKNIVFVGINHIGPVNWQNPDIFRESIYDNEIQGFLSMTLPQNVIGVCYYCYSIEKEKPFYPLKIFWREQKEKTTINL